MHAVVVKKDDYVLEKIKYILAKDVKKMNIFFILKINLMIQLITFKK